MTPYLLIATLLTFWTTKACWTYGVRLLRKRDAQSVDTGDNPVSDGLALLLVGLCNALNLITLYFSK